MKWSDRTVKSGLPRVPVTARGDEFRELIMSTSPEHTNPCMTCGACCCSFRVSFYWAEADDAPGGFVPTALTEQINPHLRAMRGTHPQPSGCVALEGQPGKQVACRIYLQRPSTCREFSAWEEDGQPNPVCSRARERIGLAPLPTIEPGSSADIRRSG